MSGIDAAPGLAASVEAVIVGLATRLRNRGVAVPSDAASVCAAAVAAVGVEGRSGVYWACRSTLVRRPEDIASFDEVFASTFGEGAAFSIAPVRGDESVNLAVDDPRHAPTPDASGEQLRDRTATVRWADREVLRRQDFAQCTADELDEVHRLIADLRVASASRPSRRHRPSRRSRGRIDLRATTQRALRTGGETVTTRHRAPGDRPRRLVLLCDISGSMEVYARSLVRFAHAAVLGRGAVEVFTIGTRCTRITRALRTHDPDAALATAAAEVVDWSSGTRLGDGLRTFNDTWGQRGMARGAVVVVLSDGWDRGEPDVLAEQTARLQRAAHRLIWVNPLKASPAFAPTAQGMAAALPYVDELVEGHSVESLDALAGVIAGSPERRGARRR